MADSVNSPKPIQPSAGTATSPVTAVAASVFIPPADPILGTWLSLGSYEEVFNSDWDYWNVNQVLKNGGMKLLKILKIHNNLLKDRFDEEINLVKKGRNSGFDPNIKDLYHGTSEGLERICHEGLDERLSTHGHFGRGIYFSDNPAFCRIQSEVKSPKNPYIVRCKVILGDCKNYPSGSSDPSLTREPVKEIVNGKNVFYDSVQGTPGGFKQYVIYEKRRALIQYVIYYTADGPLPSLPPIPSTAAKSIKKKRPKSKERKSSTLSCNSESDRHSSLSSGDEEGCRRKDSISSSEGRLYRKSSDADSVDDDDGATCCRKASVDTSEKKVMLSEPLTVPVSIVPRVEGTRARTRRLMNTETSSTTATNTATGATSIATDATGTSVGATNTAAGTTSTETVATETSTGATNTAAGTTSIETGATRTSIGATGAGAGATSPTTADPRTDAYKKKVQENALRQMLDLKEKLTDREMDELWRCYSQTYGGANPDDVQDLGSSGTDDVQLVMDMLVEQFQNVVGLVDPPLARGYITQFNMDIESAIIAYFDSN